MNLRRHSGRATIAVVAATIGLVIGNLIATPCLPLRTTGTFGAASFSIARWANLRQLVDAAELIVVAEVSKIVTIQPTNAALASDYRHSARVTSTIMGQRPTGAIRILRAGLAPGAIYQQFDRYGAAGPLRPGRSLLFLQRSGEHGVWQIVGHDVGEFPIDDDIVQRGRGPYEINDVEFQPLHTAHQRIVSMIVRAGKSVPHPPRVASQT